MHLLLKKWDKFPYIHDLDNYYINNDPYTFFIVILYFC